MTEIELTEHHGKVAGLDTVWLRGVPAAQGPARAEILYLHGNPVGSWIWRPFLERTGGIAPDLPGFGRSARPGDFDYSLPGYAGYLEKRFIDHMGLDRSSLVLHDIGAIVGLSFAQRVPERLERLVVANHAPLLPGYRWHRFARIWRLPMLGELFTATMTESPSSAACVPRMLAACQTSSSTGRGRSSTAAPSTPFCASTAPCPRPRWRGKAAHWTGSAARRS